MEIREFLPDSRISLLREEDSPGTETISEEMRVKITGEDLYISAKLDAKTDILYWFKKCMFNELFTFYRVGTIDNNMPAPATLPDVSPDFSSESGLQ